MNTITILAENINSCNLPEVEKKTNINSIIVASVLLILSATLFVLSGRTESNFGSSSELFVGVLALGVAVYLFLAQRQKMIDTVSGSTLSKDHIFYSASDLHNIKVSLANRNFKGLSDIQRQPDGNVQLAFLYSKDRKYIAIQVQKYEPFEYKPYSEIYVFRGDEAERLIGELVKK